MVWSLIWVFGIEWDLLEIGIEFGNITNFVHNDFS